MFIAEQKLNNILILYFPNKISIESTEAIEFKEYIHQKLAQFNYQAIIDLNNLEFIDSSGISAMISGLKFALINNGWLKLVGLPVTIKEVFKIIKLDKIFQIYDSIDAALEKNQSRTSRE